MFIVTPYCMSEGLLLKHPHLMLQPGEAAQPIKDYTARKPVVSSKEHANAACDEVFGIYQNIDQDQRTPDGRRSMMVGDLCRVISKRKTVEWLLCTPLGW